MSYNNKSKRWVRGVCPSARQQYLTVIKCAFHCDIMDVQIGDSSHLSFLYR